MLIGGPYEEILLGATGFDQSLRGIAARYGMTTARFPCLWKEHGGAAGSRRNAWMIWYATDIAVMGDCSRNSTLQQLIASARRAGLAAHQDYPPPARSRTPDLFDSLPVDNNRCGPQLRGFL